MEQEQYLNYVAQKIYDVLAESVKNKAYLEGKRFELLNHKTNMESLIWSYHLSEKNRQKFADSLGVTLHDLNITLDVISYT
jgi:hypothetical protein